MNNEEFRIYLDTRKSLVESHLDALFSDNPQVPPHLLAAMRYSLLGGGKRIRPILCMAAAEAVGGGAESVLTAACALECIHTYSLIHDDLPAMDDDDFRRGKPTCHRIFGDALAILAGDALLTEAFAILAHSASNDPDRCPLHLQVLADIAAAAGAGGMVGGQVMDIEAEGGALDLTTLYEIHAKKTGAMIVAAITSGARLGGATEHDISALSSYGRHLGLAFQIADDILNVVGDKEITGKATGSDEKRGKVTFPALVGLDEARQKLEREVLSAMGYLSAFGEKADPLRHLATYVMERQG